MNLTEEEFEEEANKYGQDASKNMLVMCAIAKAEGFEVTDDIYTEKAGKYAEESGFASVELLEEQYSKDYIKQVIINEEVIRILEESAVGVEAPETEAETVAETAE